MKEISYENFFQKILPITYLIDKRTKFHEMQKLSSSSYKYQIAMEFKIWGPYMKIDRLKELVDKDD